MLVLKRDDFPFICDFSMCVRAYAHFFMLYCAVGIDNVGREIGTSLK